MLVCVLLIAAAAVWMIARSRNSEGFNDPHAMEIPASDEGVLLLIHQQKLIPAIKMYREVHNVGLKEAKDAVEALAAGRAAAGASGAPQDNTVVIFMIRRMKMVDAIRVYRELNHTDLKTAKEAVEALAKTLGPSPESPKP